MTEPCTPEQLAELRERFAKAAANPGPLLILPDVVERITTEWGVRYGDGRVAVYGTSRAAEQMARMDAEGDPGIAVRRTVTYGPWEEMRDARTLPARNGHNPAGTGHDGT